MSVDATKIGLLDSSVKFQAIIDTVATQFDAPAWKRYFTPKYNRSLDIKAILAVYEAVETASVIDYSSGKPIKTRPTASQITTEMCKMGNQWQMNERELREYIDLTFAIQQEIDGVGASELIDHLYGDMERAVVGPHKTIDRMILQGMSENKISVTASNNDGVVWEINLGAESFNVAETFDNLTALPLDMFKEVKKRGNDKGIEYRIAHMTQATFDKMMATTQMKGLFTTQFVANGKTLKTVSPDVLIGVEDMNSYLSSKDLPTIEVMKDKVNVGGTSFNPFIDDRICFSEDNNFGNLYWTNTLEDLTGGKDANKSYAKVDLVSIAKYSDGRNEWTENELNAMPVFKAINKMIIVNVAP